MRFMILIKATAESEAGVMPSEQLLTEMGAFNEELVKAGVMQAGEGLQPSSRGARVRFSGTERQVFDGPFTETKELIAGFWIWQVKSLAEAVEWVKRCPDPMPAMPGSSEIEIRQVFEAEDFGPEFTPELRAQEDGLRRQLQAVPPARGAIPYLVIKNAAEAITFYQKVFGADVVIRLDAPDGKPMHAELKVGPASFMLTEERPEYGALSPLTIGGSASTSTLYVPDVDTVVAGALASGAQSLMPVQDQFWGDRSGCFTDPFGHKWMVSTHLEDPSLDQLKQRMAAMFAAAKPC